MSDRQPTRSRQRTPCVALRSTTSTGDERPFLGRPNPSLASVATGEHGHEPLHPWLVFGDAADELERTDLGCGEGHRDRAVPGDGLAGDPEIRQGEDVYFPCALAMVMFRVSPSYTVRLLGYQA